MRVDHYLSVSFSVNVFKAGESIYRFLQRLWSRTSSALTFVPGAGSLDLRVTGNLLFVL